MRGVVGCLAAWLVIALAALAVTGLAQAQPTADLPTVESGKLGTPGATMPGSDVVLFDSDRATRAGEVVTRIRKAIADCKPDDYVRGMSDFLSIISRAGRDSDPPFPGEFKDEVFRGRAKAEHDALFRFFEDVLLPAWHRNCPPRHVERPPVVGEPLPTMESGDLRLPENPIEGTPIAVFDSTLAQEVRDALGRMRKAVDDCDLAAYDAAFRALRDAQYKRARETAPAPGRDRISRGRAEADSRLLERWLDENWIRYPSPCNRKVGLLDTTKPFSAFVLGGGSVATGGSGTTTGIFGARVRGYMNFGDSLERPDQPRFRGFFETGVQTGFGATSYTQSFSSGNTGQGLGQQTVSENFQIPILIGLSVPMTPVTRFDAYAGITLDSWTHGITGRDGAAGFSATQNRFTVDPTIGAGVQFNIGSAVGIPNLILGFNAEAQFRPGSTVAVQSSAFGSQTFSGSIDARVNVLAIGRLGISF